VTLVFLLPSSTPTLLYFPKYLARNPLANAANRLSVMALRIADISYW